jgi:hypothetical protein
MVADIELVPSLLAKELSLLWAAHEAVGLDGYMQLYTRGDQVPFRAKQPGISFWFDKEGTAEAIVEIIKYYHSGQLPNSPLLLNPIVHKKQGEEYAPLGSGFAWCQALSLGVDVLNNESAERLHEIGAFASTHERGDNDRAGLKVIAFTTEAQPPTGDGNTVIGCHELYELANIKSDQYYGYYLLSGISYLTNNGLFQHSDFMTLLEGRDENDLKKLQINVHNILDAAFCWNAYDRHHSLYKKFGRNTSDVEQNLRFFNLVARDVRLFDATGPMRKEADAMFEFIVPGWLPRGAVTLIGASGGTGKSSLAHQLCVMAAIDYKKGEEAPKWLGQRLAVEKCGGISIYFSGEDGPPIINARASVFDPKGRAKRLMFQRTDFGEGVSFSQHLKRLHKIPDVPIMVIDPARKYLTGDEEDAGVVSEFFEAIEEFAITKHTAVVVVHHLQKGAYPRSAREVLDLLRGSQVFIDRPRVVIGMYRDGPYTIAGLAKNNIPPNMGMVMEERVFARDPQHLSLIWLPGEEGVRAAPLSEEELEAIEQKAKEEGRL